MSALGQKRTFAMQTVMSALPPIADMQCNSECPLSANSGHQPLLIARWLMRPVSGTKLSKCVARSLSGNLHQAGKRLIHFEDQKNCTGYR